MGSQARIRSAAGQGKAIGCRRYESRQHAQQERSDFLHSFAPRGRGGRVNIMISDVAAIDTLINIVVANPTCRDLVERASRIDLVVATNAEGTEIAHAGRCLCRLLWKRRGPYLLHLIDF